MSEKQSMDQDQEFILKYVKDSLNNFLVYELISYVNSVLKSSEIALKERSDLATSIERLYEKVRDEEETEIKDLKSLLNDSLMLYDQKQNDLELDLEEQKKLKESLGEKNPYDIDKMINNLEIDLHEVSKDKETARRRLEQLNQDVTIKYLIAPVKTDEYTALRLVLPISSSRQLPVNTLVDYIHAIVNTEVSTTFQEEAFGNASIEFVRHCSAMSVNRNQFHAIDVICDEMDLGVYYEMSNHLSEFMQTLLHNTKDYFKEKDVEIERNQINEANLRIKPLIFPVNTSEYVNLYTKKIINQIESLWGEYKKFILDNFGDCLKKKSLENFEETPLNQNIFTKLSPYKKMLDNIIEQEKTPFLEGFYQSILKEKYKKPTLHENHQVEILEPEYPKWMEKTEAINTFFVGLMKKYAVETFEHALGAKALRTKYESGKMMVNVGDLMNLNQKVIMQGNYVRGVYDEPVQAAFDFAAQHNLDKAKLNRLIREGRIPLKAHIPKSLYVLRLEDTEKILEIYQGSN